MVDLSDTTAVVTGASRGVGRGIAVELGAAGATVYVTGRSVGDDTTEGLPGTVGGTARAVSEQGGEGIAVRCDHTVDEQVTELFDLVERERGGLDLLVNNVWGGYEGHDETFADPCWEQPLERWDRMFDAGLRAHFTATRLAAPLLMASGGGLIVFVSFGDDGKFLGSVPYDVSKAAIDRLAKGVAHELRDREVASVVVYPGFTRTERVMSSFEASDEVPDDTHSPAYVGRAVAALAADDAVMKRTGGVFKTGALAREYGFTDTDGTQPAPYEIDSVRL